jgi:hypothetical protein
MHCLALLPHLNRLDSHAAVSTITPSRQPLLLRIPEISCSRLTAINPGLAILPITRVSLATLSLRIQHL